MIKSTPSEQNENQPESIAAVRTFNTGDLIYFLKISLRHNFRIQRRKLSRIRNTFTPR